MTLEQGKDLATILGVVVAAATLAKGTLEYTRAAVLRRMEYFSTMKSAFIADSAFAKITELLESGSQSFEECDQRQKWRYLLFFEEVALLTKARLLHDELALYMFGYYALLCDRSKPFWSSSFPKNQEYWPLFFSFVKRMEEVERKKADLPAFVARLRA